MKHWWIGPLLQTSAQLLIAVHGNWAPKSFPRAWRGRRVTVCYDRRTWMTKMEKISKDRFASWSLPYIEGVDYPPRTFYFKDKGITWCFGWSGKHVDALCVSVALAVLES